MPSAASTGDSASGGSPLENVATIWPLPIAVPQVSTSLRLMGVGQEAGAEKLVTSPVGAGTSLALAQTGESAAGRNPLTDGTSDGVPTGVSTTSVTLTV